MMKSVKYNFYKIFIDLTPFYFCYYIIYLYSERNITIIDYLDFSEQYEDTNHEYLLLFQEDLENAGLRDKTIYNHLSNADLFINEFLIYNMDATMEEGVTMLGDFLGDFFIRKCMWSAILL